MCIFAHQSFTPLLRSNAWQQSAFPMIPGHELIGTIVSAGSGVTEFKVGQRVGVGFLRDACMQCANCKSGQQNICLRGAKGMVHPVAEGVGARGCFQDVVHANTAFVFAIPDELDSASAAPLMCAVRHERCSAQSSLSQLQGVTVYAPLKRNLTKPGMRVAIIGTGGLGHLAVQFASAMGGIVTAVDTVEAKATTAKMLGAAEACTFDTFVKGSCGRFDLVLDCSTVLKDAAPLLEALVPGGTLVWRVRASPPLSTSLDMRLAASAFLALASTCRCPSSRSSTTRSTSRAATWAAAWTRRRCCVSRSPRKSRL